jgi:hypothetical protein
MIYTVSKKVTAKRVEWYIAPIKGNDALNARIDGIRWVDRNGSGELEAYRMCQHLNSKLLMGAS